MKFDQLIVILSAQASVLDGVGADKAAGSLRSLASAFSHAQSMQVKAARQRLSKAAGAGAPGVIVDGPTIGAAVEQLRLLLGVLEASSAKSSADVAVLIGALEPIAQLQTRSIDTMLTAQPEKKRAAAKQKVTAELDAAVVRQFADRLASANGDDQKFKSILDELKAQRLSKPSVAAIANRYLEVEPSRIYKSVVQAFQRIEERHFQDAVSASRERAINQINH